MFQNSLAGLFILEMVTASEAFSLFILGIVTAVGSNLLDSANTAKAKNKVAKRAKDEEAMAMSILESLIGDWMGQ